MLHSFSDDKDNKMTIVLDVSFDDSEPNNGDGHSEITRKKVKHNACSSKANKVAKVKHKVNNEFSSERKKTFIKIAIMII
jgi:hypothetical protein